MNECLCPLCGLEIVFGLVACRAKDPYERVLEIFFKKISSTKKCVRAVEDSLPMTAKKLARRAADTRAIQVKAIRAVHQAQLDRDPLAQCLDERNDHEEGVGRVAERLLGAQVLSVYGQLVDAEPSDLLDLATRARLELGLYAHVWHNVQAYDLIVDVDLQVLVVDELVADVVAGLFEHLAYGAVGLGLLLEHLSLGKAPRSLSPEALHEQHIAHRFVEYDRAICGHRVLEHLPLGEDLVDLIRVLHEERTVAEYVLGKGANAARLELVLTVRLLLDKLLGRLVFVGRERRGRRRRGRSRVVRRCLAIKIQVEPVSDLDLKENTDEIRALLFGHIYYKSTVQYDNNLNMCRYTRKETRCILSLPAQVA